MDFVPQLHLGPINRSILQGSAIGPHFFLVYIDDLKPLGTTNAIVEFADDTTLLVPEACDVTVEQLSLIHI